MVINIIVKQMLCNVQAQHKQFTNISLVSEKYNYTEVPSAANHETNTGDNTKTVATEEGM